MSFRIPTAYHRSFRFAVVVQILAVLLSACVDDNGFFMAVMVAAWAVFWMGALALTKLPRQPSWVELAGVRYGPLAIVIVVFATGQYADVFKLGRNAKPR